MSEKIIRTFVGEAEEALWWFDDRELHADHFVQTYAEGRVRKEGNAQELAAACNAAFVHLTAEDGLKTWQLAEGKGRDVDTYMATLVQNAFKKEYEAA